MKRSSWFLRGILLVGTLLWDSDAGFPTWTHRTPNSNPIPLNKLNVNIEIPEPTVPSSSSSAASKPSHDIVLFSLERATALVNGTVNEEDAAFPMASSDTLKGLVNQYGNSSTAGATSSSTILVHDGTTTRFMLVRTSCNTTADARKLGMTLASTIQSTTASSKTVQSCSIDLTQSNLTSVEDWSELSASLWKGFYKDIRFQSQKDADTQLCHTIDLVVHPTVAEVAQQGLKRGQILAEAVALARDIVNAPHNVLNSISLAETAKAIARRHRRTLSCQILGVDECEALGMGAFLGVARGSETSARFIHLTYRPKSRKDRKDKKILGIVGKGLLFDTGGYNIKTGMSMTNMKFDCGGAAAVLGAAQALAELEPPHVECHILIAACENMINERAMVPGDILVASNQKTIEVLNTDAEGRLTMADALVYADQILKCDEILELSTLTGSCMSALGTAMAGLFTKDDEMAETLSSIATSSGDKLWRLPMEESYAEELKSKLADLKNIGGRFAGATTAALFLQNFVEHAKFAHVDMAGSVWDYKSSQASGYGARLVSAWALHHAMSV